MGKKSKKFENLELIDNGALDETREYKRFNVSYNRMKRKKNIKVFLIVLVILLILCSFGYFAYFYVTDVPSFNGVNIVSYDSEKEEMVVEVNVSSNTVLCGFSNDKESFDVEFVSPLDNKCVGDVSLGSYYVHIKNKFGVVSSFLIDNFVVSASGKDNYYLAVNGSSDIDYEIVKVGEPIITINSSDTSILEVKDDVITGRKVGNAKLSIVSDEVVFEEIDVVVSDVITKAPKKFDTKKKYLPCNIFNKDEVKLLDTILEDRINSVGKGTRAAAVEAARFLNLEFPYRITYFFENGRLDVSGVNYVDGEGRYYHEGLYLGKTKEKQIKYTFAGPAMWGCPLMNYEDANDFVYGVKYPNGLDCSGFVSWVLKNAGFDPGDIGAGNAYSDPRELTDLGEFVKLDDDIIYSDRIKVGDLINDWGHIAIIVGIDDNNFYVAESLDIYGGVVIRTYPKKTVTKPFSYVVLMDDYYKEDGKLTDMWY